MGVSQPEVSKSAPIRPRLRIRPGGRLTVYISDRVPLAWRMGSDAKAGDTVWREHFMSTRTLLAVVRRCALELKDLGCATGRRTGCICRRDKRQPSASYRLAFLSFFAARFSSKVLAGFFLPSFFRSMPLLTKHLLTSDRSARCYASALRRDTRSSALYEEVSSGALIQPSNQHCLVGNADASPRDSKLQAECCAATLKFRQGLLRRLFALLPPNDPHLRPHAVLSAPGRGTLT